MAAKTAHWGDIQQNTFTRWTNDYLSEVGEHIDDLKTDLASGIKLIKLLEVLSGKKFGKYNKHPRIGVQKAENINMCLNFIKEEGIKIVNIGADDLMSGNIRIILGLIWTLILRYELKAGGDAGDTAANELLKWIQSKIPEYHIKNFQKDWNNGKAICALVDAIKPGLCPDHKTKGDDALANAAEGIDAAANNLGVDRLVLPDEMINPKVDKLAMMTYLAQFRNIKPEDLVEKKKPAEMSFAYGPGLQEGLENEEAPFTVETPAEEKVKLKVKVIGPKDEAKVTITPKEDGKFGVTYMPTAPGVYKIHVLVEDEHVPGSIFTVMILEKESLGGEGKIRVFYSTTASNQKARSDRRALETLLEGKKVHLREDFEPWHAVDIMDREDREAVFRRAGSRKLPIVFIDDEYIGDYDDCHLLEQEGKLDALLNMNKAHLVSADEHKKRLLGAGDEGKDIDFEAVQKEKKAAEDAAKAAASATPDTAANAFCQDCGAGLAGAKFCPQCGKAV
eukprot:gb/GEZN01004114.1/.p1 GENE.gb/GEZN01004114.1/~~gb/GEZN01004114.1/.p1  ORF type:complete len:506 (+),score=132.07 gb/GEZN01004114.1/:196-1713(+)